MTALPEKYGLPVVISSFFGREDNYTTAYRERGTPVFDSPEKAARGSSPSFGTRDPRTQSL